MKNKFFGLFFFLFLSFSLYADSIYEVQKGDTLYSLSRKYQITVNELRIANNLSETDVIKAGEKLTIPSANIANAAALTQKSEEKPVNKADKVSSQKYTVQKGDTLYGLSRKYGISVADLMNFNGFDSSSTLKIGQVILIPGKNSKEEEKIVAQKTESSKNNIKNDSKNENPAASKKILWPLENPKVKNISGKVSGVLLTGKDNESVKAVREGTVMYTGVYRGFGELVFVQSKTGGLIYSYSGLDSVSVKKGDYILSGSEIGKTGRGKESSIKFMVFKNGKPVNPETAPRG